LNETPWAGASSRLVIYSTLGKQLKYLTSTLSTEPKRTNIGGAWQRYEVGGSR
jgi:hypothetical protein